MRDINLQSAVLTIDGYPSETKKVMFLYDDRGWAMRCYDASGNKLVTLVSTDKVGLADTYGTLQNEQVQ